MVRGYVPEAGDIVWLHFDPQAGHEQAGHRPTLVLSPSTYNGKTGLMLFCPMTTQVKGYPFEVQIAGARPGAALADQVKSVDWVARKASHKGRVSSPELAEVDQMADGQRQPLPVASCAFSPSPTPVEASMGMD